MINYPYQLQSQKGMPGASGKQGNGIADVIKINTVGLVDTYRILFTNGTYKDYDVTNGNPSAVAGASTFLELTDTPSSYIGQAGKVPKVNVGESSLEFVTISSGGDMLKSDNLSGLTDYSTARSNLGLGSLATQSGTFSGISSGTNTGDNATNSLYSGLAASKEDVSNKSTSVTTDQASNTKYPSVKSIYDWATGLFATISNLALKAPIASPTFTGTVTLPNSQALVTPILGTPTSGVLTNTTGYQDIKIARILPSTATDGATVTFDLAVNNKYQVTIAGNRTLALSNTTNIPVFSINIKQDATGSRTVTWFSGITWEGGTAPTLTTSANKTDSFGFQQISTGVYLGFIIGQNI